MSIRKKAPVSAVLQGWQQRTRAEQAARPAGPARLLGRGPAGGMPARHAHPLHLQKSMHSMAGVHTARTLGALRCPSSPILPGPTRTTVPLRQAGGRTQLSTQQWVPEQRGAPAGHALCKNWGPAIAPAASLSGCKPPKHPPAAPCGPWSRRRAGGEPAGRQPCTRLASSALHPGVRKGLNTARTSVAAPWRCLEGSRRQWSHPRSPAP